MGPSAWKNSALALNYWETEFAVASLKVASLRLALKLHVGNRLRPAKNRHRTTNHKRFVVLDVSAAIGHVKRTVLV